MALNHYVTLGRSGLRVSRLCLGTMTFGLDWGWGTDPTGSKRILDAYLDKGGNFIDTANIYTKGHSERIIGDHIGSHPHKRQKAVIATKFMGNMYTGDPNGGGAHRKAIYQQLENSLRRLQTDYVDLYWMHFFDPYTPIEETMSTLDDLVRQGKVRYIGFSDTPAYKLVQAQMLAEMKNWTPLIALQIEYSLLERTVECELIPAAMEIGLGVTPWSPLKGGVLTGKYSKENVANGATKVARGDWVSRHLHDRSYAVIDALKSFADQVHATPSQIAIAWVQSRLGVTSTIIGARSMDQLNDNLKALDVHLMPEHLAKLDELTKPTLPFPHEFLRGAASVFQGGTTINANSSDPWPLAPKGETDRH